MKYIQLDLTPEEYKKMLEAGIQPIAFGTLLPTVFPGAPYVVTTATKPPDRSVRTWALSTCGEGPWPCEAHKNHPENCTAQLNRFLQGT